MTAIGEILDRLSGVADLKERFAETNRNVDRALAWLLDHEKRILWLEATAGAPEPRPPRLTRG